MGGIYTYQRAQFEASFSGYESFHAFIKFHNLVLVISCWFSYSYHIFPWHTPSGEIAPSSQVLAIYYHIAKKFQPAPNKKAGHQSVFCGNCFLHPHCLSSKFVRKCEWKFVEKEQLYRRAFYKNCKISISHWYCKSSLQQYILLET